jgi:hypothetical protein
MGAWLGRRSKPRVEFNEAVRVIWPGEVSGVVARAVNLSLAGIRVDAPTPAPCAVGTDVLCDVTLPRGPRLLRGRVAHRRLLSSAKVGMGIEFVDLSARELAELRAVVGDAAEGLGPHPQRVKVRFEGTNQVVRARAFPTESGFRLATSLPFLKTETEVEIALPSDAGASVRGWVSAVALERSGAEESPRLFIDVRVDDGDQWVDRTAITDPTADDVTPIEAVPAHVWDEDEVAATTEVRAAAPSVPTIVASSPALPPIVGGPGSAPHLRGDDADLTEIVALPPPRSSRWRALAGGMIAGAVALAAFVAALVVMRSRPPAPIAVAPAQPAAPALEPAPVPEARVGAPEAAEAPAAEPPAAAVSPAAAPVAETFSVGLSGSLAGVQRYLLRNPDGVAFNLPHAQATMKLGTYHPAVRGLKAVWVRALPGGGAHLRFFFASARSAPRIDLGRAAVVVTAR